MQFNLILRRFLRSPMPPWNQVCSRILTYVDVCSFLRTSMPPWRRNFRTRTTRWILRQMLEEASKSVSRACEKPMRLSMHAMLPRSEHDEEIVKTTTRTTTLAIDRLKDCIDCNISILCNFLIELQFFNELTPNIKFMGAQVVSPRYFKTCIT
jgi:hypothetical protein